MSNLAQIVEPYVPIGGLKIINEYAPYILDDLYMSINPYMINGFSFNKCLEAIHKESLKVHARVEHLGNEIL